jgi:hypothetical protein
VQTDVYKIGSSRYQYIAVDDCSRYMVVGFSSRRTGANTSHFINKVVEEMPFAIERMQTSRGREICVLRPNHGGRKPAQLLQAVVIDLARYVVQGVTKAMDITALPGGLRQDFTNRRLKSRMSSETTSATPLRAETRSSSSGLSQLASLRSQDLAVTVPVDAASNRHGIVDNNAALELVR